MLILRSYLEYNKIRSFPNYVLHNKRDYFTVEKNSKALKLLRYFYIDLFLN